MIELYRGDAKRIQHFCKVHSYAKLIAETENVDKKCLFIIEAAALTHDIGIHFCEEKYGNCNGKLQEQEGPAIAERLLEKLGFEKDADWVEYKIYIPDAIPEKHQRISDLIQRKYNLKIKKYTSSRKIAADYGQAIFELMNEAYSPLYGYSPLSQRQIDQYVKMYLPIVDLRMVTLITDAKVTRTSAAARMVLSAESTVHETTRQNA